MDPSFLHGDPVDDGGQRAAPEPVATRAPKVDPDSFLDAFDEFTSPKRKAVDAPQQEGSQPKPRPRAERSESSPSSPAPGESSRPRPRRQMGGLSVQRASDLPPMMEAEPSASSDEQKTKADEYYEMCMKDLHDGRVARAWGYAKMAADADPSNEKYRALVRDWNKMTGGTGAQGPSSAASALSEGQRLIASAQEAETRGDLKGAIELMRQACEMFPDSGSAHNRLAVLLSRAKEFRAAVAMAAKAAELEPDNPTYRDNMMTLMERAEGGDGDDKPKARGGFLNKFFK